MQTIDTLIFADHILPINPRHTVLADHAIAIDKGKIIDILGSKQAQRQYASMHTYHLDNHVVMPGLVNTHNHAAMSLFRGLADDLPLMDWLNNHIWPAEGKWVSPSFVEDGSLLAIAEMLSSGTTCFNDMYFFPDAVGQVAAKAGIRAAVGLLMMDFPTPWAKDPDEYLDKAIQVHDRFKDHPLITTTMAPHAPYTVSDAPLKRLVTIADQLDIPIQMHIHETPQEVEEALNSTGVRPLKRLEKLGVLSPRLQAVHMTQLNDNDIAMIKHHGVSIVHCPQSNMKLASGICPIPLLLEEGVNIALGTDGPSSNNDLDMFKEMKTGALLAKVGQLNAAAFNAEQVIYSATMGGAHAMGLGTQIGSLEKNKLADIIAIDLDAFNSRPYYNLFSQLVYAINSRQVSHSWVAGKCLLSDGQLTTIDINAVKSRTNQWQHKIFNQGHSS